MHIISVFTYEHRSANVVGIFRQLPKQIICYKTGGILVTGIS